MRHVVAAWIGLVSLSACSPGGSATDAGPPPPDAGITANDSGAAAPPATLTGLVVSTGDLVPPFDPAVTDYTITSLNSLFPVEVTATGQGAGVLSVNEHAAVTGIPVGVTLAPRQDIVVRLDRAGTTQRYTVHYLPVDLPAYAVAATAGAGPENILLSPNASYALLVNRAGDPLYYRSVAPMQVWDFQQQHFGGATYYSFTTFAPTMPGKTYLMDDHFRDLGQFAVLANRDHGELTSDLHDFRLLGDQHYLTMANLLKTVDLSGLDPRWSSAAPIYAAVVQEVDHGRVVFEWQSTDLPSLYTDSVDGNAFTTGAISDYVHLNSLDIDPADGNFIVSLRHTDSVLKLDRTTGALRWTLGGRSDSFGIAVNQRFSHQHFARMQRDGSLLLFDNGNDEHQTRVLSFRLDEAAESIAGFNEIYEKPTSEPPSTFMGSVVSPGPGRYVIGWGGWSAPATSPPSVTEIVDGTQVWSLTFASPGLYSYRALPALPE